MGRALLAPAAFEPDVLGKGGGQSLTWGEGPVKNSQTQKAVGSPRAFPAGISLCTKLFVCDSTEQAKLAVGRKAF